LIGFIAATFEAGTSFGRHIRHMRMRFPTVLSAALLVAAILLIFRDELHARGPHRLNRLAEHTECGFWGPMSAGMSCQ
jgi:hypothetical protein